MVLLCCGQATAAFRTCSMAKTEANTAISKIAQIWNVCVTFGVYRSGGLIDGYSALCVVYEVSLEVVMTTRA